MSKKERREGAERIFRALSGVDEELLERSEADGMFYPGETEKIRVNRLASYRGLFAACICLCVVAGVLFKTGIIPQNSKSERPETAAREEAAYEVEVAAALNDTTSAADAGEEMTEDETLEEMAEAAAEDASGQELSSLGSSSSESSSQEGLASGSGATGQQKTQPDMESLKEGIQYLQITEEQARNTENLGAYLPASMPENYVFADAYCTEEAETPVELTVIWSRGDNNIVLGILAPDSYELDQACMADPTRPETYDVNLYKMPYADSVPKAYYTTFDNPIFKREDLSEAVVQARLKKTETSQNLTDAEAMGGNFRVLFEDGTLISFNGCGSAKEVYDMFLSIDKIK